MKNVRGGRFFFNIYFVIIIILAGLLIWAAAPGARQLFPPDCGGFLPPISGRCRISAGRNS